LPPELVANPDGTMTAGQAVQNGIAADNAAVECRRRQKGLLDAWPKPKTP